MDARETDAGETDADTARATPGLQRPTSIQRLAAAVALLALAGAIVVVAVSLLGNPGRLVLVALAVTAAWTALVHRGGRRWLAAGLAVAALVAVVLLLDVTSLVRIALVVGLVVLSTAAARVAIRHHLAPSTAGRPVGPAGRAAVRPALRPTRRAATEIGGHHPGLQQRLPPRELAWLRHAGPYRRRAARGRHRVGRPGSRPSGAHVGGNGADPPLPWLPRVECTRVRGELIRARDRRGSRR